jgi:hypothetical protein
VSLDNLAPKLPEDDQNKLAAQVVKDFESDNDSRKGWLEMHAGWLRLFNQSEKPKSPPWPGASEESLPLLTEACTQFHARAYKALFPGRTVVTAVPTLKLDVEVEARAKRVAKHMSWQLMVRDRGYKADKDRLLFGLPLHGSFFTKTYFHPVLGRNMVENVRPEDLVIPYGVGPRDIDSVERKTQIVWQTINDARILVQAQFYSAEPEVYNNGEKTPTQSETDKSQGLTEPAVKTDCCVLEQHAVWDLDGDGIAEPYIAWVCRQSKKLLRLAYRFDADEQGAPTDNKRAVEYFTHYNYLPNPEGFYGLGMGHLIGPINKAVNKLVRQAIDAATLANIGNASGFVSSQLDVKGGEIEIELGKFRKINASMEDIAKGIYQFKFPGPSASIGQLIELFSGRSDRLGSVTELVSGQADKVYQPTMAMALIEQALEVYGAVQARVIEAWGRELQKYYDLNTKYMPDVEPYVMFMDDGSAESDAVTKDDYRGDLMVQPLADPKQATTEKKLMRAQAVLQFVMTNPLTMQNPMAIYAVGKRYLEAIEEPNIDEIFPPPLPPREDDPYKENATALMPQPMVPPPYPDQDHMGHIVAHQELLMGKEGHDGFTAQLPPEGKKALEQHIQMHIAQMYEAEHGRGNVPQGVPGAMGPAPSMAGGVQPGGIGEVQGTA